jgi:heme o synthase
LAHSRTLSLSSFSALVRLPVSLAVVFSALVSASVCNAGLGVYLIVPIFGIFLLACGASALNQYQERFYDARMDRTRSRPLPAVLIRPATGLLISVIILLAGLCVLAVGRAWICLLLGLFNIGWYNGLYTWLKKKTAFAVVPGALTGAIPVFMGWSAAGGSVFSRIPLLLAFFIFMWQIPHFWMLMLKYGDEYRNAGLPVLTDVFTPAALKRIIMVWIVAASASSLLLAFGLWPLANIKYPVIILNAALLSVIYYQLFISGHPRYRLLFISLNLFLAAVLFLLTAV